MRWTKSPEERFFEKVSRNETTGCWEWMKARPGDYGYFRQAGQNFVCHRWLYASIHGPIPKKAIIRHKCDNRKCVSPFHLVIGTIKDNVQDCVLRLRHGSSRKTHCKRGHPLSGDNLTNGNHIRICLACGRLRGALWRERKRSGVKLQKKPISNSIFTRLIRKESGCWEWSGARYVNGYGMVTIARKSVKVSRWVYEFIFGTIPPGKVICHRCDNPICANPFHLFAGTKAQNMKDCFAKGRHIWSIPRRSPSIANEHSSQINKKRMPCGIFHHNARLRPATILEIRASYPAMSYEEIAKKYGIHLGYAWKIVMKMAWKHVP